METSKAFDVPGYLEASLYTTIFKKCCGRTPPAYLTVCGRRERDLLQVPMENSGVTYRSGRKFIERWIERIRTLFTDLLLWELGKIWRF